MFEEDETKAAVCDSIHVSREKGSFLGSSPSILSANTILGFCTTKHKMDMFFSAWLEIIHESHIRGCLSQIPHIQWKKMIPDATTYSEANLNIWLHATHSARLCDLLHAFCFTIGMLMWVPREHMQRHVNYKENPVQLLIQKWCLYFRHVWNISFLEPSTVSDDDANMILQVFRTICHPSSAPFRKNTPKWLQEVLEKVQRPSAIPFLYPLHTQDERFAFFLQHADDTSGDQRLQGDSG